MVCEVIKYINKYFFFLSIHPSILALLTFIRSDIFFSFDDHDPLNEIKAKSKKRSIRDWNDEEEEKTHMMMMMMMEEKDGERERRVFVIQVAENDFIQPE